MTKQDIGWLIQMNSRLPVFRTLTSGKAQLGPKVVMAVTTMQTLQHVCAIDPSPLPDHAPDVCEIVLTCQHYPYLVVTVATDNKLPEHNMCVRRTDAGCRQTTNMLSATHTANSEDSSKTS